MVVEPIDRTLLPTQGAHSMKGELRSRRIRLTGVMVDDDMRRTQ